MLVFVALLMVAFLVTVVFSIDLAHMHLARTQLRTATDAAAKAASLELSGTQDRSKALHAAKSIAKQNSVAGSPLVLKDDDIQFGRSEENTSTGKFVFSAGGSPFNSVRIHGDRTRGSASGSVGLVFGKFFGVEDFQPEQYATATFLERDVVLVLDRSGSMNGRKSRDLISAIQIFVDTLDGTPVAEFVGLASYSNRSSEDVQMTTDLSAINAAMDRMRFAGATSISRGMDSGERILNRGRDQNFVERTMIVMTDGLHNSGAEPRTSAIRIAASGVTIHTITFGSGADVTRMREVSQIGRGQHFHAANGGQLREIYRDIALTLSTMITK